ncbi:unnamed protein product [Musa textilis]
MNQISKQAQGGENWKNFEATIFPFKGSKYIEENRGRLINICSEDIKQLSLIDYSKISYICSLNYGKAKNLSDCFINKALVEIITGKQRMSDYFINKALVEILKKLRM